MKYEPDSVSEAGILLYLGGGTVLDNWNTRRLLRRHLGEFEIVFGKFQTQHLGEIDDTLGKLDRDHSALVLVMLSNGGELLQKM